MSDFICPVCKKQLIKNEKVYICESNHSFDISKDGYVNLLMSQQSSLKRHGDDKLMIRSRREFLEKGFYKKLSDGICDVVRNNVKDSSVLVDIGCGEGYYLKSVLECGKFTAYGIDISKDALKYASKALKSSEFAVASAFSLPFSDSSVDCLLNVFAPSAYEEFYRVLKPDGVLIKAVPLENHLWDLKCALYDEPYKNKPEKRNDELFQLVSFNEISYTIELNNHEDIGNLFRMTPYYYKTGRTESERLLNKENMSITVHFGVELYKKR